MDNFEDQQIREKLLTIISEVLGTSNEILEPNNLAFKVTPEWDSITHIRLMAKLRIDLNVELSFEDMVEMVTYSKILEILVRKLILNQS